MLVCIVRKVLLVWLGKNPVRLMSLSEFRWTLSQNSLKHVKPGPSRENRGRLGKTGAVPGKPGRMGNLRKLGNEEENKKRWYLILCEDSKWRRGTVFIGVAECGSTQALTGTMWYLNKIMKNSGQFTIWPISRWGAYLTTTVTDHWRHFQPQRPEVFHSRGTNFIFSYFHWNVIEGTE